jgi:hypothetical protein
MASNPSNVHDMGGISLVVQDIKIGATAPGQASSATSISGTELGFVDGVTAGTATASKAVVLGASKDISTITSATITTLTTTSAIIGGTTIDGTDAGKIDGITNGTVAASKAIVVDASKELTWAMTDSGVGTVTPLNFTLTASGVGASVDGAKFTAATEAALGSYANALNAKLDFGTAGAVTGLGGAFCAELDLGPGTTSGSYAVFEGELNVPTSGSLGTRTSFFSLNAWGANVAAFDTGGFLFDINGVTGNTGKFYRAGLSQAVTATARLRCQVAGVTYYIPLCVNEALTS